jgi:protein-tyrosine-phosphatase
MKLKVVFICYGNACRSIMAEALARHLFGDRVEAASAGIFPLGLVTRETRQVLTEMGASTVGLYSKGLQEIRLSDYQLIVNLSDYSLDSLIPVAIRGRLVQCPVTDPYGGSLELYRQTREALQRLLPKLLRTED